jgi:biopolymer transport protein ExbD
MTHLQRVPLDLPKASSGIADPKSPPIQIAIDANGVTTWDQKIVTATEITNRLKSIPTAKETRVLISADQEARHKQVLAVLNATREAGIEKVSFETAKP